MIHIHSTEYFALVFHRSVRACNSRKHTRVCTSSRSIEKSHVVANHFGDHRFRLIVKRSATEMW